MIFEIIAKAFIESHRLTWENFPLSEGRDNQSLATLTDPDLILRFQDFHCRMSAGHIVLKHNKHNLSEGAGTAYKQTEEHNKQLCSLMVWMNRTFVVQSAWCPCMQHIIFLLSSIPCRANLSTAWGRQDSTGDCCRQARIKQFVDAPEQHRKEPPVVG